jgi:hypothetical protein
MQIGSDSSASGEEYIYTPEGYQGTASFSIEIMDPGSYMISARIIAPDTGSDSFYVGIDGEDAFEDEDYTWDTIEPTSWTWVDVSKRGPGGNHTYAEFNPMIWTLSFGIHTFLIYGRESGTQIDQLVLKKVSQTSCAPLTLTKAAL